LNLGAILGLELHPNGKADHDPAPDAFWSKSIVRYTRLDNKRLMAAAGSFLKSIPTASTTARFTPIAGSHPRRIPEIPDHGSA
jgi:hypothetical protein